MPGNTRIRQVGLRAASVCCKSLAILITQLIEYLIVALTLHMVTVRIVRASGLVVYVFRSDRKYKCSFVCSFTCVCEHLLFALSQWRVILCNLFYHTESRLY